MKVSTRGVGFLLATLLAACSSTPSGQKTDPSPQATSAARPAPKVEAKSEGGIVGTPRPGSKFAGLKLGMSMDAVQTQMGRAPDRIDFHETGKRWIPFYFGPDARRLEALYKGDGCLTFTGGNVWGGAGGDLLVINHDATGACFNN